MCNMAGIIPKISSSASTTIRIPKRIQVKHHVKNIHVFGPSSAEVFVYMDSFRNGYCRKAIVKTFTTVKSYRLKKTKQ